MPFRVSPVPALLLAVSLCFAHQLPGGSFALQSNGKAVQVDEYCKATDAAPAPLIVFLHGSGGPGSKNLPYVEEARRLSSQGYCVELPRYLGATGGSASDPARHYPVWAQVVTDTVDYVNRRNGGSAARTALVGYSLGASVALAAAVQNPKLAAVIAISGSLPDSYVEHPLKLPPLLLIHGDKDQIIPAWNATQLTALCKESNAICDLDIYQDEGHIFTPRATQRIADETDRFLKKRLPIR